MWMVFVAYLLLRRFGGAGSEVLAAAVGLFGMALVPFVYWSVNFWRTLHPTTNVVPTLPPDMWRPFCWCAVGVPAACMSRCCCCACGSRRQRAALEEAYLALED